ncbi:MAG TPA: Gfo/Idh/MocA family oxidoreductase [Chloroflexota bacterium]|nr:Gfo/Idh/MocA family oxidoreductase [Chloroflexota bacterium]
MTATQPLRFGILGTGGMGITHAREILAHPDATVTALCDSNEAAIDRAVGRLFEGSAGGSIDRYTSLDRMLAGADVDAVVVATPHTQHTEHIRKSLEAGKHVLCEKPMATIAADARATTHLAEQKGLTLAIAYQRHGEARYRKAHEIVSSGILGDLRLITVLIAQDCLKNFIPGATWRADPTLSGGGHFMDTGSHIVDMMLWVSGLEPESVYAQIDNYGTLVDVVTALTLKFTNGAVGTFAATSLTAEPWREEFSFYGTEGVLIIRSDGLRYQTKGGDTIMPRIEGRNTRPVENFIAAIKGDVPAPQAPPVYGLRVAQVSEAAYKSAESGQPERVG